MYDEHLSLTKHSSLDLRLIAEGTISGITASFVVVAFRLLLQQAEHLRTLYFTFSSGHFWRFPLWFLLLTIAAFVVYRLLVWEKYISGSGIPQIKGEMEGYLEQNWWRVILAKCVGAILSIGCGLSLGREGPSIQLGAMSAKAISKLPKRFIQSSPQLLLTCGASAGLAAAFNAPLAGILFSLEEIHKKFSKEIVLSTMASCIAADFISRCVFGLTPVFPFSITTALPLNYYGHLIVLGCLLGLMGSLYNLTIATAQNMYQKIPYLSLKMLIPFWVASILAILLPETLGGGHGLAMEISEGQCPIKMLYLLFIVKFLFSMISFGSGAPGGIFLPLLVLGSILGAIYFGMIGMISPIPAQLLGNFMILGMVGYFTAIVRAPIVGLVLIVEMTGSPQHLLSMMIVTFFAHIVPDLLRTLPIYDQLLLRLLHKQQQKT